jgi:hypothetical protein
MKASRFCEERKKSRKNLPGEATRIHQYFVAPSRSPPQSLLGFHQGIILHWFIQIDFSILSFLFFGGQFLNCK